jgi:OmpA-OmpF porin, OOP family
MSRAFAGLAVLAMLCIPMESEAQSVLERAKQRARERVEQRTDQAIDRSIEAADNAISCVVTDAACIESARKEGRQVVVTDEDGNVLPASQQPAPAGAQAPAPQQQAPAAGQGAWANYDFVPGERILFYEDFSRDRVGNFPQRIELLSGNAEIVEWNGRRWLRANGFASFRVPLPENLPERFTVEFDMPVPWFGMAFISEDSNFDGFGPSGRSTSAVVVGGTETGVYRNAGSTSVSTVDPRRHFGDNMFPEQGLLSTRIHRVSTQVDGRYIKVYVDEHRMANMPNGAFGRENYLVFEFSETSGDAPLITNISVNAGGQRMYDALMADGRVSTQGILFATGSDVIRPESTPTLKEIGDMLKAHPDLRLRIEGHTDNVGQAAANQALSEKRAAAVREYLLRTFGVEATRLEAQGFGAARPAAPNDTAEGRQSNRRVELVRL